MADSKSSKKSFNKANAANPMYGLGLIGAFVYYIHVHSGTFWLVILAVLKAVVWPALVVYHVLLALHM
ncbi:MAG: hypothetical protein ACHQT9_00130 [Candidatus Saccharimonadales bacterium]